MVFILGDLNSLHSLQYKIIAIKYTKIQLEKNDIF